MADNELFYYRGFPLIRCGDVMFYGCGGDAFAAKLTIKDKKVVAGTDIPNKVLVQLIPHNPTDMAKARKGEYIGFYEALDTAHIWLKEALFG